MPSPPPSPSSPSPLLLKLGGSLITDKARPDTARPEVLARLAAEIASALGDLGPDALLVLGHGSGSFGHAAAARHGLAEGLDGSPERRRAVAVVRERATALHRLVLDALVEPLARVGRAPFSIAPSSCLVTDDGAVASFAPEPLLRSLDAGLVPVLFGDVVLDRRRGVAICSTETALGAAAAALAEAGRAPRRALWAGTTRGILDDAGASIERIEADRPGDALAHAGGSVATDVTGGMLHRLESTLALAHRGIESWILDATEPGVLERALAGDPVEGTRVVPADAGDRVGQAGGF